MAQTLRGKFDFTARDGQLAQSPNTDTPLEATFDFLNRTGHFDVCSGGRQVNTMGPGEWFGEIGLLHRRPRTATVTADTDSLVWRIPGDTFLDALTETATEPSALLGVMAERMARSEHAR